MLKRRLCISTLLLFTTSCATMSDSLKLGAGMGAGLGAAATYAAYSTTGREASLGDVALGAGIGLGVGLLTSYVVHRQVDNERQSNQAEVTEMHFGDLPPSPFVIPKALNKKGGH